MKLLMPLLLGLMCACGRITEPLLRRVVAAGVADPSWAPLGHECRVDAPAYQLPASMSTGLPKYSHGSARTSDDDLAEAARAVPGGFAGMYIQPTGMTVLFVNPEEGKRSLSKLTERGLPISGVDSLRRARWSFAKLADWYRFVNTRITGGWGSAIDQKANRIELDADSTGRVNIVRQLQAQQIPCWLVAVVIGRPPVPAAAKDL